MLLAFCGQVLLIHVRLTLVPLHPVIVFLQLAIVVDALQVLRLLAGIDALWRRCASIRWILTFGRVLRLISHYLTPSCVSGGLMPGIPNSRACLSSSRS